MRFLVAFVVVALFTYGNSQQEEPQKEISNAADVIPQDLLNLPVPLIGDALIITPGIKRKGRGNKKHQHSKQTTQNTQRFAKEEESTLNRLEPTGTIEYPEPKKELNDKPTPIDLPTQMSLNGNTCASTCRRNSDSAKDYWCYLIQPSIFTKEWEYCTPLGGISYSGLSLTTRGVPCKSECTNMGRDNNKSYDYYFCYTEKVRLADWDYCAPAEGRDYKNQICDKPCDYSGEDYKWCRVNNSTSWGYC